MADLADEGGTALDIDSMVDEIGEGLGFGNDDPDQGDEADPPPETPAPKAPAATEPSNSDPDAKVTDPVTPPTPVESVAEAPKTWRKEAAAVWATLPSEAKNEILKREQDIFQGLEGYKADAGFGKSIKQVLAPFEAVMRAQNMDPAKTIGGLVNYHHQVGTSTPDRKASLLIQMAKNYGVNLVTETVGEPPYIDPTVLDLQNQLRAVQSELSESANSRRAALVETTSKQVDEFASKAENVYFNEVADDIANLIAKGVSTTLQDAYDKAVWANPVTRAKEIARSTAEATAKSTAEAKARATAAKSAIGANVKTTAKSGRTAAPTGSIDDTLAETLANIQSRG